MSSRKYHSVEAIIAMLKKLGINPTPKPEPITVEGEREKLLPNWKQIESEKHDKQPTEQS